MIIKKYQVILDEENVKFGILLNDDLYDLSFLKNNELIYSVDFKNKELIIKSKNSLINPVVFKNANNKILYYAVKAFHLFIWNGHNLELSVNLE